MAMTQTMDSPATRPLTRRLPTRAAAQEAGQETTQEAVADGAAPPAGAPVADGPNKPVEVQAPVDVSHPVPPMEQGGVVAAIAPAVAAGDNGQKTQHPHAPPEVVHSHLPPPAGGAQGQGPPAPPGMYPPPPHPHMGWHPQYGPPPPHFYQWNPHAPPPPHMRGYPPPGPPGAPQMPRGVPMHPMPGYPPVVYQPQQPQQMNPQTTTIETTEYLIVQQMNPHGPPHGPPPGVVPSGPPNSMDAGKLGSSTPADAANGPEAEGSKETPNNPASESGTTDKEESTVKTDQTNEPTRDGAQPPVTVKKEGKDVKETTGTPATMNTTLSEISPSAFDSGGVPTTQDRNNAQIHVFQHGMTPWGHHNQGSSSPPQNTPGGMHSLGSFSRITGPPSAWAPPPSTGQRQMTAMPPQHAMPPQYVYQYQHFDPRSDVGMPLPPRHHHAMMQVPPTVHMPGARDDFSPLPDWAQPKLSHHEEPGTPSGKVDEEDALKASPLDLLSSALDKGTDPGQCTSYPIYKYPPPPGFTAEKTKDGAGADDTPPSAKSTSMDQLLSAANTLDVEDVKSKGKKRHRKEIDQVKKKLHKMGHEGPPNAHPFQAGGGGYPPGCGVDPTTQLPPGAAVRPEHIKVKSKDLDSETVTQAQKATILAQQALERPRVGKQLLLSMALVRTNPRTPPSCYPAHGTILADRFHWASYPPLDNLLRKNMKRYYELSTQKCQSRDQQEFNNELVNLIKEESQKYGWEFDDKVFDDKKIRDRIRCFYKTHIQNAKKRLKTMLKDPEKRANVKALAAHFHLIEEKAVEREDDPDGSTGADGDGEADGSLGFGLSQSYSSDAAGGGDNRGHYALRSADKRVDGDMMAV